MQDSGDPWDHVFMADEIKEAPCDFGRHQQGGTCDCLICGWHVWDIETQRNAAGVIVVPGGRCLRNRPRADQYGGATKN